MRNRVIEGISKTALLAAFIFVLAGCGGDLSGNKSAYTTPEGNIQGYVYSKVYNENAFARRATVFRIAGRDVPDGYTPVEGATARVTVGDETISDTTDSDGMFLLQDVETGTRTVQVSKNGQSTSFQVTVVQDATTVANDSAGDDSMTLDPASSGILAVNATASCTNPTLAEATVYILGPGQSSFFDTGMTTPAVLSDIAPGSYSVQLQSSEYQTSTTQVTTVTANNTSTLNFTLTPSSGNLAPFAQIGSPGDNASYTEGASVVLAGAANDCEDGTLTGSSLAWSSDQDGSLGTGVSVTVTTLSVATHTITLTAMDSGGKTHSDSVTIVIGENTAPTATITSPVGGTSYNSGAIVYFIGAGTDTEDGAITDTSKMVWTSDIDGQIGTGPTFSKTDLSAGDHTITLTVTDSGGKTGTATVSITVSSTPSQTAPTAVILSPNTITGTTFTAGTAITFRGQGIDPEDGQLAGSNLSWSSSVDGTIGTGTSVSESGLSTGDHTITLTVTDSDNMTGQATIDITVSATAVNNNPVALILTPNIFTGTTFTQGTSITFTGQGLDAEATNGQLTGTSLVWTSSIDGQFGTGTSVSESGLSAGTHTITLTVTDADGATATATVTITIN